MDIFTSLTEEGDRTQQAELRRSAEYWLNMRIMTRLKYTKCTGGIASRYWENNDPGAHPL